MFLYTYIAHLILLDHVLVWVTIEQHTEKVCSHFHSTLCEIGAFEIETLK